MTNTSYPQGIAAESEDYFLILKDAEILPLECSSDGQIISVDAVLNEYAFIRKEDFWNNNPNYIDIK